MRLIYFSVLLPLACTNNKQDNSPVDTPRASAPQSTRMSTPDTMAPPKQIEKLALVSPGAGDTLVEGRTYVIRWTAGSVRHINIGAAMGGHDKGLILNNAPAHPDSLSWKVPIGFVTGFGPRSSNQIRLRLENADSTDQWVESKPFVITGAAPASN
jgi:hypothetical protein